MVDYICPSFRESHLIGEIMRNPGMDRLKLLESLLESKSHDSGLILSSEGRGPDPPEHRTCANRYPNIKWHHTYCSTSVF